MKWIMSGIPLATSDETAAALLKLGYREATANEVESYLASIDKPDEFIPPHLKDAATPLPFEHFPIVLMGGEVHQLMNEYLALGMSYTADITLLLRIVEIYQKALERTEARIAAMALTTFPINVRELDGSISQHRPKSNAGEAYDDIRQALALADEIAGKGQDE